MIGLLIILSSPRANLVTSPSEHQSYGIGAADMICTLWWPDTVWIWQGHVMDTTWNTIYTHENKVSITIWHTFIGHLSKGGPGFCVLGALAPGKSPKHASRNMEKKAHVPVKNKPLPHLKRPKKKARKKNWKRRKKSFNIMGIIYPTSNEISGSTTASKY